MGLVLAVGTVGFRLAIHESWLQSFYRAVVSSTLTGLDTVPRNDAARIVTIFLVLAGISIFAYIGSLVVEAIARGVIGGAWGVGRGREEDDPERNQPPRELAAELAARAEELEEIDRAEVAGPGFLNLWVTTEWLAAALQEIGPDYGAGSATDPRQKIQVELISANPAGPLTVRSARNGAHGDSVARLLADAG